MLGHVKIEWNNNFAKNFSKGNVLIKKAFLIGSYRAVNELAEIGMEEVRKSQSYHATEKLPTRIMGDEVKGGYVNRTKGISYAEYGTGTKATHSHNPYPIKGKAIWFTRNPRAEKYYKKRINKHTGEEYYVVFPQKAQRRFFFAKKKIQQRRDAVITRNLRKALREAGK